MLKENQEQIQKYINYLSATNKAPNTINLYSHYLKEFFKNKSWKEIELEDITDFINKKDKGLVKESKEWEKPRTRLSTKTKNNFYTILGRFMSFSEKEKLAEKMKKQLRIKEPKKDRIEAVHLTEDEIMAMSKVHLAGSDELNIRNNLILYFLVSTGVRTFELTNLKKSSLNLYEKIADNDNRLVSLTGKGSLPRKISVPGWWINFYLKKYHSGCDYLFCSKKTNDKFTEHAIWFIIKEKAKQARLLKKSKNEKENLKDNENLKDRVFGISRQGSFISPHKLRSTWFTNLHMAGTDLLTMQRLGGHASSETTEIYTKHDDEKLKKAHQYRPKKVNL